MAFYTYDDEQAMQDRTTSQPPKLDLLQDGEKPIISLELE